MAWQTDYYQLPSKLQEEVKEDDVELDLIQQALYDFFTELSFYDSLTVSDVLNYAKIKGYTDKRLIEYLVRGVPVLKAHLAFLLSERNK